MANFQNGKIYKIVDLTTNEIYIGSTIKETLSHRLAQHTSNYRQFLDGNYHFVTSFNILKNNNYQIELLELYPCETRDELNSREGFYIKNNSCINKNIAGRTKKEYYEQNKEEILENNKEYQQKNKQELAEKSKEYRKQNKEQIAEKSKEYQQQNKEHIAENQKKYYEQNKKQLSKLHKDYYNEHKEEIKEKTKIYYEQNKEHIAKQSKIKFTCECGSISNFQNKSNHFKTKKHLTFLAAKNNF
jgi:hypothetical protein